MPMDRLHDGGTQKSLRQNPTSTFKTIIMYLNIYTTKYKSEEELLGWVFWKPVNANPGLKVNQNINFSCIRMFSNVNVLCLVR